MCRLSRARWRQQHAGSDALCCNLCTAGSDMRASDERKSLVGYGLDWCLRSYRFRVGFAHILDWSPLTAGSAHAHTLSDVESGS